ncbi:MAG: VTT domain-containing protein [Phycisphaerales bacterium]|mgnify:CR=1 FL=1|jgi:uncharacterized membrane protein YdjX (TVP38/TMEM64 family)|nr:VTT domain-containing protein [Phycisphaerales bacterium]
MTLKRKLPFIILAIVVLLLTPYFIWHAEMDAYFASDDYQQWLVSIRPYAWAVGIGLIVADLFLPIPAAPIMAAMGTLYGTLIGGVIATIGTMLAGLTAYGLARLLGMKAARLLASESELDDLQEFFDSWGAAGIIASRALPVVPEVMTLLAGLANMHFGRFLLALTLGSVPIGFAFAWVGQASGTSSSLILILTLIPALAWCVYVVLASRRRRAVCDSTQRLRDAEDGAN